MFKPTNEHSLPLVVKPKEACRMLACSNTRLYELLSMGELQSFRDGRSRKITVLSIREYIAKRLSPHGGRRENSS
jgi:excisionase family DNA binding protein